MAEPEAAPAGAPAAATAAPHCRSQLLLPSPNHLVNMSAVPCPADYLMLNGIRHELKICRQCQRIRTPGIEHSGRECRAARESDMLNDAMTGLANSIKRDRQIETEHQEFMRRMAPKTESPSPQ